MLLTLTLVVAPSILLVVVIFAAFMPVLWTEINTCALFY